MFHTVKNVTEHINYYTGEWEKEIRNVTAQIMNKNVF